MNNQIKRKNMTSYSHSLMWLHKANLRPTKQRIILADLLIGDGKNRHITAEGLFEAAKTSSVSVSLATVYNTLKSFCDVGLLNEVIVDGTRSYFDTRIDNHPHFFCEKTGQLTDAPSDQIEIKNLPNAPEGYKIGKVDIVFRLQKK